MNDNLYDPYGGLAAHRLVGRQRRWWRLSADWAKREFSHVFRRGSGQINLFELLLSLAIFSSCGNSLPDGPISSRVVRVRVCEWLTQVIACSGSRPVGIRFQPPISARRLRWWDAKTQYPPGSLQTWTITRRGRTRKPQPVQVCAPLWRDPPGQTLLCGPVWLAESD